MRSLRRLSRGPAISKRYSWRETTCRTRRVTTAMFDSSPEDTRWNHRKIDGNRAQRENRGTKEEENRVQCIYDSSLRIRNAWLTVGVFNHDKLSYNFGRIRSAIDKSFRYSLLSVAFCSPLSLSTRSLCLRPILICTSRISYERLSTTDRDLRRDDYTFVFAVFICIARGRHAIPRSTVSSFLVS